MKTVYTLALLLLATLAYPQKSTLIKNINIDAKELQHRLNQSGDSIILKGERSIEEVEIFNGDFQKKFTVQNQNVIIPLHDVPVGRFVTQVKLKDKLIIITLLRHEILTNSENKKLANHKAQKVTSNTKKVKESITKEPITMLITESLSDINSYNAAKKNAEIPVKTKITKSFWVIKMVKNGSSSRKVMKFANEEEVDRLIHQQDIDQKSKAGNSNELTIWEIYDVPKFLKYKRVNPDYAINTKEADCLNILPYYKS